MKNAILCVKSRPVLRFAIRVIVASRTKTCKRAIFLPVLYSGTMSYGRIENQKPGGESTSCTGQFVVLPRVNYLEKVVGEKKGAYNVS